MRHEYCGRAIVPIARAPSAMAGVGACGDVVQPALVRAVGRAARQHEAAIAVTAIDIAVLVDLQPHARMTQRGAAAAGLRARAMHAADSDLGDFGWGDAHGRAR